MSQQTKIFKAEFIGYNEKPGYTHHQVYRIKVKRGEEVGKAWTIRVEKIDGGDICYYKTYLDFVKDFNIIY